MGLFQAIVVFFSALALGLGVSSAGYAEDAKKTKENAHAFLASVLGKGSTKYKPYSSYGLSSWSGAHCSSEFKTFTTEEYCSPSPRCPGGWSETVDFVGEIPWNKVSEVVLNENEVTLKGAILVKKNYSRSENRLFRESSISLIMESESIANRAYTAMDFLRTECDETAGFGF